MHAHNPRGGGLRGAHDAGLASVPRIQDPCYFPALGRSTPASKDGDLIPGFLSRLPCEQLRRSHLPNGSPGASDVARRAQPWADPAPSQPRRNSAGVLGGTNMPPAPGRFQKSRTRSRLDIVCASPGERAFGLEKDRICI